MVMLFSVAVVAFCYDLAESPSNCPNQHPQQKWQPNNLMLRSNLVFA
jgi:hypothetical protein